MGSKRSLFDDYLGRGYFSLVDAWCE
jgi:hypothetical protein